MNSKRKTIRIILITLLFISLLISASLGAVFITPIEELQILFRKLVKGNISPQHIFILEQIRWPRVMFAAIVGASLGMSGAAVQGLFRNPLADPGLIGISSGASLFAVISIVLFSAIPILHQFGVLKHYLLNIFTFIGAGLSSILIFKMATKNGKTQIASLLLSGIAINALAMSVTGLITYTANDEELRNLTFWSLGSLGGGSWKLLISISPFTILPLVLLPRLGKSLNLFSLGENEAMHLGVNIRSLKTKVILLATMAVGSCVAAAGFIGFVGLIIPHIIRSILGTDHRQLLTNSALLGAVLLTIADTVCRTIIAPAELPIGIITSLLGAPFFVFLLMKQRKNTFFI